MYKKVLATATYIGTIIGVGLYALPYVTTQVGFATMVILFVFLGFLTIVLNQVYGEIVLRTPGNHRLPGYAKYYLNRPLASVTHLTSIIGLSGSLLAYIIVGGGFLNNLLQPIFGGSSFAYTSIFFIIGSLLIYLGSKSISNTDILTLSGLAIILIFIFIKVAPHLTLDYLTTLDLSKIFLPYGVILFALDGTPIIPELREILGKQAASLKQVITCGVVITILVYFVFVITIVGITGPSTSPDALSGLIKTLGGKIIAVAFVFGIITTFTSFLSIGITLKKQFQFDLKFPPFIAWITACGIPLLLLLLGIHNYITIISFIGSFTFGIAVLIILAIYQRAKKLGPQKPAYALNLSRTQVCILCVFFLVGIIIQLSRYSSLPIGA